jgi:hypothetical protein
MDSISEQNITSSLRSVLRMPAVCSSDTLVPTYKTQRRQNPKHCNNHLTALRISDIKFCIACHSTFPVSEKFSVKYISRFSQMLQSYTYEELNSLSLFSNRNGMPEYKPGVVSLYNVLVSG